MGKLLVLAIATFVTAVMFQSSTYATSRFIAPNEVTCYDEGEKLFQLKVIGGMKKLKSGWLFTLATGGTVTTPLDCYITLKTTQRR